MDVERALQEALNAHRQLLNDHLEIWREAEVAHFQDLQIILAARNCRQRTEQMIQQCSSVDFPKPMNVIEVVSKKKHKRSEGSDGPATSKRVKLDIEAETNPTADPSMSTGPRRVPVTNDPSGLFQIDSNPDPVAVLIENSAKLQQAQRKQQAKKEKKKRRNQSETEDGDVSLEVKEEDQELPTLKRKKSKHNESVQESAKDADDYHKEFTRKVAVRLKEQEEQRQKKANKKRKRESEASVEEHEPEVVAESEAEEPQFKKGKGQPAIAKAAMSTKAARSDKGKKRNSKDAATTQDTSQQKPKKKKRKKSA